MKKIIIITMCLILISGCGKENNIKEVYDGVNELNEQYKKTIDSLTSPCADYVFALSNKTDDNYNECISGLESLQKDIKNVDDLMKKNSNKDLYEDWKERKKQSDAIIPDLIEYYKVIYSLEENHKNISSLSNNELKKLDPNITTDIAKALKIEWYDGIYQMYASAANILEFDKFKEKVENLCKEDTSINCSFEVR